MFGLVRIAVRFFVIGLAVGVLLAPRRGEETRQLIRRRASEFANAVLEIADLPPVQVDRAEGSGAAQNGGDNDAAEGGTRRGRRRAQGTGAAAQG